MTEYGRHGMVDETQQQKYCGFVCFEGEMCEKYNNPLSCKDYVKLRTQHRMNKVKVRGQMQLS